MAFAKGKENKRKSTANDFIVNMPSYLKQESIYVGLKFHYENS